MAGSGKYTIVVNGILDDKKIRAQIAAIQKELNSGKVIAGGTSKSGGMVGMEKTAQKTAKATKGAKTQMVGLAGASKNAVKEMGGIAKKVVAFGAVTSAIQMASAGVTSMVGNIVELDGALREYKKVSDLSSKGLEDFTKKAYEGGKKVAKTGVEMIESATEFKKMGFSDADSLQLGQVANMFINIADSEISAGEAASFINSQLKAFNWDNFNSKGEAAAAVIDKVNEVANKNGVSTTNLQSALTKAGSALGSMGNSYEQTLGLLASTGEILTNQPGKTGRGLRTIAINLGNMAAASDEWVAANGKFKVALKDSNGDMRSTYDIMKDSADQWKNLTKTERNSIAASVAGRLKKVLALTGLIDGELLKSYTLTYNGDIYRGK